MRQHFNQQPINEPKTNSILHLNRENFKQTIENHAMVVVDFWADWCEPCMTFSTIFEEMAQHYPQWQFGMVNMDTTTDIASFFNVTQIPCLLAIKNRVVVDAVYGEMKPREFAHHLQMWEAFNMTEINAHFDAKEAAQKYAI